LSRPAPIAALRSRILVAFFALIGFSGSLVAQPGQTGTGTHDTTTITPLTRLHQELESDSALWRIYLESLARSDSARMVRNLSFTMADITPTAEMRRDRAEMIRRGQDWDFIHGKNTAYLPLFSVSTGSIFRALGLTEDVTPRIRYTVNNTTRVTVIVYNLQAERVATLVDAPQPPGVYSFDWNMLNESGQRVVYGDYVAEVRIGGLLVLRKHIEVP
jgi:hypothetical protein